MSSGGKGGSSSSQSYNYYGSIAAVWHMGQMDTLTGIIINERLVWEGTLIQASSPNPVEITIPDRGIYRHYWGLPTQTTVDPILLSTGNTNGDGHPAYTNICYGVFVDFLFGLETTTAPSIMIRGSRAPVQSLITGASAELVDSNANPFCVLAELLLNEQFGLGLDPSMFAVSTWQAAADLAAANPSLCYVSPYIDSGTAVRSLATDLFTLCDGWLRSQTGTGLCEAGLYALPETVDTSTLPTIDSQSLTIDPDLEPQTWDDVQTTWVVHFLDRDYNFKERSLQHDDPGALQRVGDVRPTDLQRDFIVRYDQALAHAREWGRRNSLPGVTGKLTVRSATVDTLRPGTYINANFNVQPGGADVLQLCKVDSITRKINGVSEVTIEAVRTTAPVSITTTTPPTPPTPYAVPCIANVRYFETPYAVSGGNYNMAALAARPDAITTSFNVLYDDSLSGSFPQIATGLPYAVRGEVVDAFAATDGGPFHVELLDTLDRDLVSDSPGDTAAAADTVLMIVFKISSGQIETDSAGDDYMEMLSCSAFTADGANKVYVTALRGREGTTQRAFAVNDEVWFIRKSDLETFTHPDFSTLASSTAPAYFETEAVGRQGVSTGCPQATFQFAPSRQEPPSKYPDLWPVATLLPGGASFSAACKTRGGTVTVNGFAEFTSPSSPPKAYLEMDFSGNGDTTGYSDACVTATCHDDGTDAGSRIMDAHTGAITDTGTHTRVGTCSPGVTDITDITDGTVGAGDSVILTQTTKTITNDLLCHAISGGYEKRSYSPTYKAQLTNENTDSAALTYFQSSLADWSTITAGSCSGVVSNWGIRTTGFTYPYEEARLVLTGGSYYPGWDYYATISFEQSSDGVTWSDSETDTYLVPADGSGSLSTEIDYPITEGYQARVKTITLGLG